MSEVKVLKKAGFKFMLKKEEEAARVAQLVSARPSMRVVPSSIPGDITSLCQLLSFLCSFN